MFSWQTIFTVLATTGYMISQEKVAATVVNRTADILGGERIDATDSAGNNAILVYFYYDAGWNSRCTAIVANNEWLVTAAHCLKRVVAGDLVQILHTNSIGEKLAVANTTLAEIYQREEWNPETAKRYSDKAGYDFGMFRLSKPMITCDSDDLDCNSDELAQVPGNAIFAYDETAWIFPKKFTISGYGDNGDDDEVRLRKGSMRATSRTIFGSETYWKARFRNRPVLNFLRGRRGSVPTMTCGGDSGGPWMLKARGFYVVAGLTSGGTKCGSSRGTKYAFRLTESSVKTISKMVQSTGGSCRKSELDSKPTLQCMNSAL